MKKLLADFLKIEEIHIKSYKFLNENYDLEYTNDGYRSPEYIKGQIYEPQYATEIQNANIQFVSLEELLIFLYERK